MSTSDVSRENIAGDPANAASDPRIIAQVHAIVRAISSGRVMSYGEVGKKCNPPISGYICGRIMHGAVKDVPWWRVVGKDGKLPINKRHPQLASEQREKLEAEGIAFDDAGRILMDEFAQQ